MEMEKVAKSTQALAKKLRNLLNGVVYLLRKGLSNSKLFLEFSTLLLKRTHKLIGKLAIHSENDAVFASSDYEFSCSNTPAAFFPLKRAKFLHRRSRYPLDAAVREVLEMVNGGGDAAAGPESPAVGVPGFWRSPATRQLTITDSPFPVKENEEEAVKKVNKAADEFIKKFYMELRQQKSLAVDSPYHDVFLNY